MYKEDSTLRVLSENVHAHKEQRRRRRSMLRLSDGSRVELLGYQDSPEGRWLKIRPGGWVPAVWLLDL